MLATAVHGNVAYSSSSYYVDGVDVSDVKNSERFYDTGKGYYWDFYELKNAVNSLSTSTGGYSFLGELEDRITLSGSSNTASFSNLMNDANTCWYQVASNVLQYWQSYYGVFCNGDKTPVYGYTYDKEYADKLGGTQSLKLGMYFYDNWLNAGGNIYQASSWYLTGNDSFSNLKTEGKGGFYSKYYGENESCYQRVSTYYSDIRELRSDLFNLFGMKKQVDGSYVQDEVGKILYLGLSSYSSGHALTCYGFTCNDDGYVTSLTVTNSDDSSYELFNLYLNPNDKTLWLYEDEACTKIWNYSDDYWYLSEMYAINTSEKLKNMYSVYSDQETPLVWNGVKQIWQTTRSAHEGEVLPDASTGWEIKVDSEYYHAYSSSERKVLFNDYAANKTVQVKGSVSTPEMILDSRQPYTFTGTNSAIIQANSLIQQGSGNASFSQISLSGNSLSVRYSGIVLGSGGKLSYTSAEISDGGSLTLAGGNVDIDSLYMGDAGRLVVSQSGSLTLGSLTAASGSVFEFGSSAVLSFDGNISSDSRIDIVYADSASPGSKLTLITFADSENNWATLFSTTYGTLSYANNTLYLTYTPHPELYWGNSSSSWSASTWLGGSQSSDNANIHFNGTNGGTVTIYGEVRPYVIEMTDGNYTFAPGDVSAEILLSESLTLSGDATLVNKVPMNGAAVVLRDSAALTLNEAMGSTVLHSLNAQNGTTLVIDSRSDVSIGNVYSIGKVKVNEGATLSVSQKGTLEFTKEIQSTGTITFQKDVSSESATYIISSGADGITGNVNIQSGVTLRMPGNLGTGVYNIDADGVLELSSSGTFSASAFGNGGTIRILPAAEEVFTVNSSGKPSFSSDLCMDVQGSASISNVSDVRLLSKATVSGTLSVTADSGEVTLSQLVLDGGVYDMYGSANYGVTPASRFVIDDLNVSDNGGTLVLGHYSCEGKYVDATVKSLSGTGDVTMSGQHFYAPVIYRLQCVGPEDYTGTITLLHDSISWEATYSRQQGTILELDAVEMSGSVFIKNLTPCSSEAANALFFTALGLNADATIGGLASTSSPATRAILYSGSFQSGVQKLPAGTNFNTYVTPEEHTLTISAEEDYAFYGIVEKSLSLVKKGKGVQSFMGDMSNFDGFIDVQGGTLSIKNDVSAKSLSVSKSSFLSEGNVNAGSSLSMTNGLIRVASLISSAGVFSGVNTIEAESVTGGAWTLNLATANVDEAVLTIKGNLDLSEIKVQYNASQVYTADYLLLRTTGEVDLTSQLSNTRWETEVVDGVRYNSLLYSVVDGEAMMPRTTPATLTWKTGNGVWAVEQGHDADTWAASVANRNFYDGDTVEFNRSATVSLEGTVNPAAVSVSNTSGQVIFNGSGKISGSGSFTKSGAGTLEIRTANDYTGDTIIQAGTVKMHNLEALGRGNVLLNGGILVNATGTASSIAKGRATLNGGSLSGDFTLKGSSGWDVKVDTAITGSLTLENGSLTLHNTSLNISGALTLGNATLTLDGAYGQGDSYTLLSAGSIAGNVGSITLLGVENYNLNIQDNALVLVMNTTVGPDIPDAPVTPDEPEIPDTPVTPDEPEIPDTPVTPDEPVIPDIPVTPDEPGNPDSLKPLRPGAKPVLVGGNIDRNTEIILTEKGSVTLEGKLNAGAITVISDANISFKSNKKKPGFLAGNGELTKSGKGTLTLNDGNSSWTGDTYLKSGTIKVKGTSSLGQGDVYVQGGTLNLGSKSIGNDIVQSRDAAIKSGKKFTGTYTLEKGELQKGSTLNINRKATLEGGTVNGTLSGIGKVLVDGNVKLGDKGKITANDLTMEADAVLKTSSKGLVMGKSSSINMGEMALLHSYGKVRANNLSMNGSGFYAYESSKASTVSIKSNVSLKNGSVAAVKGKLTVGNLTMDNSSLYMDPMESTSALQSVTVKGQATLTNFSELMTDKLTSGSLTMKDSTLTLTGSKPKALTVKGTLSINSGSSIIMDYNFVQGKTYKLITFKYLSYSGSLYELFGVDEDDCLLERKGNTITLTVTGEWNQQFDTDEAAVEQKSVAAAATEQAAISTVAVETESNPVADALVQSNWGQLEASRAFVNAMANRSMAVQLGNGERAVWASAIGASSRHSSAGGHAGADTNVSGGAFGLETQVGRASLFGMALGNSWTRVSAHGFGTIEQDTTHLGLYGQTNWRSGISADWSAAYGRSESETMGSDWSQKYLQLDGRVSYNHELNANTLLSPFAGMQYYASDSAGIGTTDTGSLQNLRAEIGVAASRRMGKFGVYGEIALHQDIARNNPSVSMEGVRYTGMNPGRTGLNFTLSASYELSDKWSVNASYTGEFVENANAHSANVGATYKF